MKKTTRKNQQEKFEILTTYCANNKNAEETSKMFENCTPQTITNWWTKLSLIEKNKCEELALDVLSDTDVVLKVKDFTQKVIDTREAIIDKIHTIVTTQSELPLTSLATALKEVNDVVKSEKNTTKSSSIFDNIEDILIN